MLILMPSRDSVSHGFEHRLAARRRHRDLGVDVLAPRRDQPRLRDHFRNVVGDHLERDVPVGNRRDEFPRIGDVVGHACLLQQRRIGREAGNPRVPGHGDDLRLVGAVGEQLDFQGFQTGNHGFASVALPFPYALAAGRRNTAGPSRLVNRRFMRIQAAVLHLPDRLLKPYQGHGFTLGSGPDSGPSFHIRRYRRHAPALLRDPEDRCLRRPALPRAERRELSGDPGAARADQSSSGSRRRSRPRCCRSASPALRWREIANACEAHLSIGTALRFNLIGAFFNQTLPSTIGGDGCAPLAAAAARRDLAGRDLFGAGRSRGRPDRAGRDRRRQPAVEPAPDRQRARAPCAGPARPGGAGRLRRVSHLRPAVLAVDPGHLAGAASARMRKARSACDVRSADRPAQSCPVGAQSSALGRDRARASALAIAAPVSFAQMLLLIPPIILDHADADLDRRLGRARAVDAGRLRLCRAQHRRTASPSRCLFGAIYFIVGAAGGLAWLLSSEKAARARRRW